MTIRSQVTCALALACCGGQSHGPFDAGEDAGPGIDCLDSVEVPAGTFVMGREAPIPDWMASGDPDCYHDWQNFDVPAHDVYVSSFRIQRYETTAGCFAECVDAGACEPLDLPPGYLPDDYFSDPVHRERPAYLLTKSEAAEYCAYRRGRLPREAEWEKAARGTEGRKYPLGAEVGCLEADVGRKLDQCCPDCDVGPLPVTARPRDVSPYGVQGMTGGVGEWVSDVFDSLYYMNGGPESMNPRGPPEGHCPLELDLQRGGSYGDALPLTVTATSRGVTRPGGWGAEDGGVRCVWDD